MEKCYYISFKMYLIWSRTFLAKAPNIKLAVNMICGEYPEYRNREYEYTEFEPKKKTMLNLEPIINSMRAEVERQNKARV